MNIGYQEHIERLEQRRAGLRRVMGALFDQPRELTLEFGCGHGHWLSDYARHFPATTCLGIDVIGDRVERANRKKEAAGLSNLSFVKAEARETLDALPEWVTIGEAFMLFPDPWPKKRHWKNRLFSSEFLGELADRCHTGTRFHFRTDHEGYFAWAMEIVGNQKLWYSISPDEWPFERETVFQARAERYCSLVLVKA